MKLCDTCTYRNNVEQLKPCIIYRDDCEYYEKERGDMTGEEAIAILIREIDDDPFLRTEYREQIHEALEMAIKALEQEPCEEYKRGWHDAIVTALKETHNYYTEDGVFKAIQEESLVGVGMMQEPKTDILDEIRAEIKQLPYQRIFGNVSSYSLLDAVIEIIDKYKAESEGV